MRIFEITFTDSIKQIVFAKNRQEIWCKYQFVREINQVEII